jgi:3'-phosphoadenosine 5'-phosphosulfate sulfotransferase (PAPS reductase)/FAD synthetase
VDFERSGGLFRKNNVPQNALHKKGFVSIGCALYKSKPRRRHKSRKMVVGIKS